MKQSPHTAQSIFKDLDAGKWKPFYLIVGEEPFQAQEIFTKVKSFFVKEEESVAFHYETWEGEGLDGRGLLASLETLPGLFDEAGTTRFVVCHRFDKTPSHALEILEPYFQNPSDQTVFFMMATKADKRKTWYKQVLEKGYVVEVSEPFEREWPRWQGYFEKKLKKKFSPIAWETAVIASNRTLSILWSEMQKLSLYVGERDEVTEADVKNCLSGNGAADIFEFAAQVVSKEKAHSLRNFHHLLRDGENEIKILSILVRQFRMVEQCSRLMKSGITDGKQIAPVIGAHPFFVSKIQQQTRFHTLESLEKSLHLLSECDYRLKRGEGGLFESFLVPYFS